MQCEGLCGSCTLLISALCGSLGAAGAHGGGLGAVGLHCDLLCAGEVCAGGCLLFPGTTALSAALTKDFCVHKCSLASCDVSHRGAWQRRPAVHFPLGHATPGSSRAENSSGRCRRVCCCREAACVSRGTLPALPARARAITQKEGPPCPCVRPSGQAVHLDSLSVWTGCVLPGAAGDSALPWLSGHIIAPVPPR